MNNKNYQLIPFQFNNADLSVYIINREPHWIAADICEILDHTNPTMALKSLDEDEYLTYTMFRAGQDRSVNLVNEAGLYHLIFTSRKPEAKTFRRWVTHEVLPSIRKTGRYSLNGNEVEFSQNDILFLIEAERKGSAYARQILMDYGFNPAPASLNPRQLEMFTGETSPEA